MSYYNTNKLSGKDLETAINKAKSQEEQIKVFMKANSNKSYTPHDLQNDFIEYNVVFFITSVRRALTNLTNDNILIKSEKTVITDYGSRNHKWRYNGKNES